jgi:hypothetical protein
MCVYVCGGNLLALHDRQGARKLKYRSVFVLKKALFVCVSPRAID